MILVQATAKKTIGRSRYLCIKFAKLTPLNTKTTRMRSISMIALSTLLLTAGYVSKAQDKKAVDSNFTDYKKPHRSITEGTVTRKGNLIKYQAIAGTLILKNNVDSPTASIFYTAYF